MTATYDPALIERLVADGKSLREMRGLAVWRYVSGFTARFGDDGQSALDQLEAAKAEVERYRLLAEHYGLCARSYKRIRELNEVCESHPALNDPIGIAAESELMDVVDRLRGYVKHIDDAISAKGHQ